MERRLWAVTSEVPFPARHGGRVDQWSRFRVLKTFGVSMALTSWYPEAEGLPSETERETLASVFEELHLHPISRALPSLLRRLAFLPRFSPHVATRLLPAADFEALAERAAAFNPHAIWLDGLYGAATAFRLAERLDRPVLYRSHNIEHRYIRSQAEVATNLRDRVAWTLAGLHLERFETRVQRESAAVFDISNDDMDYWRARGITHNAWLPTVFPHPEAPSAPIPYADRRWDIAYLGNLNTPNNIRGLEWFVGGVVPLLRRDRPQTTIRIAGSRPTDALRRLLDGAGGITLSENPATAAEILADARVLVNPILSGSGLNVKALEMLGYDAHLVSTGVGVRGMPQPLRAQFRLADDPEAFARACLGALSRVYRPDEARRAARRQLGPEPVRAILDALDRVS